MDWFSFAIGVLGGLSLAWASREVRDWVFACGIARLPEDVAECIDEDDSEAWKNA